MKHEIIEQINETYAQNLAISITIRIFAVEKANG